MAGVGSLWSASVTLHCWYTVITVSTYSTDDRSRPICHRQMIDQYQDTLGHVIVQKTMRRLHGIQIHKKRRPQPVISDHYN